MVPPSASGVRLRYEQTEDGDRRLLKGGPTMLHQWHGYM
jgi:hypothetical protein